MCDIILSTRKDSDRDVKMTERSYTVRMRVAILLMKDFGTKDIALTFGINGWATSPSGPTDPSLLRSPA